jgi:hypothetical protein
MRPENLQEGDVVQFDTDEVPEPLTVVETEMKSLGLTKVVCIVFDVGDGLTAELVGHTASEQFELGRQRRDDSISISVDGMEKME